MKKSATIISILVAIATFSIAEASVQYFTSLQANRVVDFLNTNPEILIYDANYPSNVDYVYTTDVWKEVSGLSYEVWIYGYNINTNEVVSTPVDLDYVWINNNGYPVSVARLLGFSASVVNLNFAWAVPVYRPFIRRPHPVHYYRTYYYPSLRVHRHHHHHYHGTPHHAPAPAHNHGMAHHNMSHKPTPAHNHKGSATTPTYNNHRNSNATQTSHNNRPQRQISRSNSGHNSNMTTNNRSSIAHSKGSSHPSASGSTRSYSSNNRHHDHSGTRNSRR